MKQSLLIVLSAFLLLLPAKNLFILAAYKLNQQYIASELCINRDKPESTCSGKCYLNKQVLESGDEESSPPLKLLKDSQNLLLYYFHEKSVSFNASREDRIWGIYLAFFIEEPSAESVFHPPTT